MSRPPFPSLRIAGSLLPPDLITRVLDDRDLEGRDPASYGLAAHETVREAASRQFDYLSSAWQAYGRERERAVAEGRALGALTRDRWLLPLLGAFNYGILPATPAGGLVIGDRAFPVSHAYGLVPVHLLGWGTDLDRRTPGMAGAAHAAPQSMVQELLNSSDAHLWAMVANGQKLRLLRDSRSLAGSAYVEFDLELIFDEQLFSDFLLLYRLVHASRFTVEAGAPPASCWLERWRTVAIEQGERALDGLRVGVTGAIETLGTGFLRHPANDALRARLASGELPAEDYKRTVLRTVYRLLFWFVAEDRDVLLDPEAPPGTTRRYARFFSSQRLRGRARRIGVDQHEDLWEAVQLVFTALGTEQGQPALGLPGIGGLFERDDTPAGAAPDPLDEPLDDARIANDDLLQAVHALSVTGSGSLRPVDFRHLGAEELGSVYESLLESHAVHDPLERTFQLDQAAGNERKTTGSYYTPTALTELLLDNALDPVLDAAARTPGNTEVRVEALLSVTVCDPACGSGHFLVAAARRIARRVAQLRSGEDEPAPALVRHAMREVVGRCLYGVDLNEMAAELAKVSLWLESVEPGKPLPFLDANIRVGNALLGTTPALVSAGIPKEAFRPLPGDDRKIAAVIGKRSAAEEKGQYDLLSVGIETSTDVIAKETAELVRQLPARLADVHVQRRRLRQIDAERLPAKRVADAWCAAFVQRKTAATEAYAITRGTLDWIAQEPAPGSPAEVVASRVERLTADYRFFHWHVEFPHLFTPAADPGENGTGWEGGFSCVVGNPPWERVKLQEQEFFAAREPAIAGAKNATERKRLIAALGDESPLRADFEAAIRQSAGTTHLLRDSGRYPLTGTGDVNTYSVFAETMRSLLVHNGRMGVLTPTGLATDATTAAFFRDTIRSARLAVMFGFVTNPQIWSDIGHRRYAFSITVLTGGEPVDGAVRLAFHMRHPRELIGKRLVELANEEILVLNPNTGTLPIFRDPFDAEITLGIYRRHPVLIRDGAVNRWGLSFARLFDMAADSGLFDDWDELAESGATFDGWAWVDGERRWLPLYEAKLLAHYDHRFSSYADVPEGHEGTALPRLTEAQHDDPGLEPRARYWVAEKDVTATLVDQRDPRKRPRWERDWFLGWRDIARASDVRTFIPSVLPRAAVGHKFPLAFLVNPDRGPLLQAVWSSLICDYVVRQKLSGSGMSYFIVNQLACPAPETFDQPASWQDGGTLGEWVLPRVLELSYTSYRIAAYARDLGDDGPPFRWDPARRELIRAELDAAMFHVYGLARAETEHVLDSFFVVRKYEQRDHGEFRTKRLVLAAYDALADAIRTGTAYRTALDPTPGLGPRHPVQETERG